MTLAFGVACGAAVVAAIPPAWATARAEGWWDSGYLRLVVDAFWDFFDHALAASGGVAIVVVGLLVWGRRDGARWLGRGAVAVLLGVVALRGLTLADLWWGGRGANLLLVSIDTLRADRLGTYGAELPTTPGLDRRLAGEGVVFERAHSSSPKTTPSHMTMLTSLQPCVHGIELWEGAAAGTVLNPVVPTLAEVLKNAGYATAAFTGGGHMHRSRGFGAGFDVYKHGRERERALAWLDRRGRRKWFLFFHTYQVHDPYLPPAALIDRFDPDYRGPMRDAVERIRGNFGDWDKAHQRFWASLDQSNPRDVRFVARLYDAGIRNMDDTTLTALLDRLAARDLARDTLVVFTSDHGEAFGEHGRFLHDDVHEETVRVPLVLRFPGRLPAGRRVGTQAAVLDVMPTVLDLLGVPAPPTLQGRSLVPLLDGGGSDGAAISAYVGMASVRRGRFTLLTDGAGERLFTAPDETRDVAATHPAEMQAMREALAVWSAECTRLAGRFGPGGDTVAPDAETTRRLRALGYVR